MKPATLWPVSSLNRLQKYVRLRFRWTDILAVLLLFLTVEKGIGKKQEEIRARRSSSEE